MKKILSLLALTAIIVATSFADASAQRFGTSASKDNTGRKLNYTYLTPAYSATVTITPVVGGHYYTLVKPATLTGDCEIDIADTYSQIGDNLVFVFTASGSTRTVTFDGNFIPNNTCAVAAAKQAVVSFIYDGTNYVEVSRTIQP